MNPVIPKGIASGCGVSDEASIRSEPPKSPPRSSVSRVAATRRRSSVLFGEKVHPERSSTPSSDDRSSIDRSPEMALSAGRNSPKSLIAGSVARLTSPSKRSAFGKDNVSMAGHPVISSDPASVSAGSRTDRKIGQSVTVMFPVVSISGNSNVLARARCS